MKNLKPQRYRRGKREGCRQLSFSCQDAVAILLDRCQGPGQMGKLAARFAIKPEEILHTARRASHLATFRMAIGNRIRAICLRLEKAKRTGRKLTLARAAYPPSSRKQRTPARRIGRQGE